MKRFLITLIVFTFFYTTIHAQAVEENYDSALAKKLKADDYGMKNYVLVLLKSGSNTVVDKATKDSLFYGHLNNISRLANNGSLVLAGPFGENKMYRGLFILNVSNIDEAKKLLETDPAIKAKLLDPEMYLWYGSASLQESLKIHKKIQKLKF
ncbi:MAG: hypothetical protein ABI834_03985 [Ginsengibacter sp.]